MTERIEFNSIVPPVNKRNITSRVNPFAIHPYHYRASLEANQDQSEEAVVSSEKHPRHLDSIYTAPSLG
jgi:hypothetical protein